jgi:hypothetical protein
MIRFPAFVLALSTLAGPALALQAQDILGLWRTQEWDGPGSVMELWFAEDGTREVRSYATYEGIGEYKLHLLGTWAVSGDKVSETVTGGWTSFSDEVNTIQPDDSPTSTTVEPIAGAPRKIKITECDGPCVTREFSFVSAAKDFTLEDLGAVTATRRMGRRSVKVRGSGRIGPVFLHGLRAFDLRGRALSPIMR